MPQALVRLESWLDRLCRWLALAGGLLLIAMTLVTVVSVSGRSLASAPIPGDFELVEVGAAIAVFLFLPYCQLHRHNVVVDIFTSSLSPRVVAGLDALGSLIFAAIAGILTWRMAYGGIDMYRYEEQTMILGLARWWGFIPIVLAGAVLTLVCLFSVVRSLFEARR